MSAIRRSILPLVVLTLATASFVGCSGRTPPEFPADAGVQDTLYWDPARCAICPPTPANEICFSGRVFEGTSLARSWSTSSDATALPLSPDAGVVVQAFEGASFFDDATLPPPMAVAQLDQNGCFLLTGLPRVLNVLVLVVDDDSMGQDLWTPVAMRSSWIPEGNRIMGFGLIALPTALVSAWHNQMAARGALLRVFLDYYSQRPLEGVQVQVTQSPVLYFDDDITREPYFRQVSATGGSGMIAVVDANGQTISATLAGNTFETGIVRSRPGFIHFDMGSKGIPADR